MKLTYWVADCIKDSTCYSIRKRTKKEVIQALKLDNYNLKRILRSSLSEYETEEYSDVYKVIVEYNSAFELAEKFLSEDKDAHEFQGCKTKYIWVSKKRIG